MKASNWSAASTSLEAAKRDFPGDTRWEEFDQRLRASIRNAKFAELDKHVRTSLERKDFQAAGQALDAARNEFASDPAWIVLAQETAIQAFETALKEANWTAAAARLDTARRDFPGDPRWEEFDKRIRTAKLAELDKQVRTSLERKDFQAATQALDGARDEFSNDPAWIALKQDLDRRRDYEAGIDEARRARQDKQYETAEAKLQTLIAAGPVDGRAQAALDELRAERYWPQWLDETLVQRREARRLSSAGVLEPHYNLVERDKYEGELADVVTREGLSSIPYFALASGFLTGKYRPGAKVESQRVEKAGAYLNDKGIKILGVLDEIAAAHCVSVASIALAWLAAQPTVVAPIASARTPDQLPDLLRIADLKLTKEDLNRLSAVSS